jgi:O-antigen ligase
LSFRELLDMAEVGIRPRDIRLFHRAGRSADDLLDFIDASSEFYPDLHGWYAADAREWVVSQKLSKFVARATYSAIAIAAAVSLFRSRDFDLTALDALVFAYFGLAIVSVIWATDRRLCLKNAGRWVVLGGAAFLVANGFSLGFDAALIAGGALLSIAVGAALDLRGEAYRPLKRFRFAGILHPNWQAKYCLQLLFAGAYLYGIGFLPGAVWLPLLAVTAILLVLTRSRVGFWTGIATSITWTGLEAIFGLRPTGLLVLVVLAGSAAALIRFLVNTSASVPPKETVEAPRRDQVKERIGSVAHLGRDPLQRNDLGGRGGLWRFALEAIRKRPYLGYGHGVFWTPARIQEALQRLRWGADSSHSTYLDHLLNTGLPGLALFLAVLATGALHALWLPAHDAVFLVSFFVMLAFEGLFESTLVAPNFRSFSFFLLIFAVA